MKILLVFVILVVVVSGYLFTLPRNEESKTQPYMNTPSQEAQDTLAGTYGERVSYTIDQEIQFPDFILKYTGERKEAGPNNAPWEMSIYVFSISDKNETKEISWSSGTGAIGPNSFEFKGKQYVIEKKYSEKIGELLENELVISERQ